MAFMLHNEGENYILDAAFKGGTPITTWYLGLCNDELVEADALADILGEPSGDGYSRQEVAVATLAVDGDYYKLTFAEATFTASGDDWDDISTGFLTDAASGTSGLLVASFDVVTTILDTETETVTAYLKIK